MESKLGVIPMPKYDEAQASCTANFWGAFTISSED